MRSRKVVLRDVDLTVSSGEMVALHGANGAGKTTLLQCLAGALRPGGGEVLWFGAAAASSPAARRLVGFLGHESGLYLALTGWENLVFAGRMYGLDNASDRAAELLEMVGLRQYGRQQAGCLSRGLRQRLAIARAVFHQPPILLLDEPFTSLDSGSRAWLAEFLGKFRGKGCAIVIASHDAQMNHGLADRVVTLQAGRLHPLENPGERPIPEGSGLWRS